MKILVLFIAGYIIELSLYNSKYKKYIRYILEKINPVIGLIVIAYSIFR